MNVIKNLVGDLTNKIKDICIFGASGSETITLGDKLSFEGENWHIEFIGYRDKY